MLADLPAYEIPYPQIKKIAVLKIIFEVCNRKQKGYNDGKIFNSKVNLRDALSINFLQ